MISLKSVDLRMRALLSPSRQNQWCARLHSAKVACPARSSARNKQKSVQAEAGPAITGPYWYDGGAPYGQQQQDAQQPWPPQTPPSPQAQILPGVETLQHEQLLTLETNIDDMSPQLLAYTSEKLLETGALDVWLTPAVMKKGRPGTVLSVLCSRETVTTLLTIIFYETTTLGVRIKPCERVSVQRIQESASTRWGFVPVKAAFIHGQVVTATAEYEVCAAIARQHGVPLKVVKAEAETAYLASEAREREALQS